MKKEKAFIGQKVYCGDDGTPFVIKEMDDIGAVVVGEVEETWIEYDNLFPINKQWHENKLFTGGRNDR